MIRNKIPTIAAVSFYIKGNNVVMKISLASTKEITLSGLTLSILTTNLSSGILDFNSLVGGLASDDLDNQKILLPFSLIWVIGKISEEDFSI